MYEQNIINQLLDFILVNSINNFICLNNNDDDIPTHIIDIIKTN